MRVYISGGITGITDYMQRFVDADNMLHANNKEIETINPAIVNSFMPESFTHDDYMDLCFSMLEKCDAIYMLKGWKKSTGACMEYGYALAKGMEIYFE